MKKTIFYTFLVYLVCLGAIFLINEIILEHQSRKDIEGFMVFSFAYFIVMVGFIYLPVLYFIDKRSEKIRRHYPLLAGLILNIPYFLFAIIMSGKAFQPTEAILFCLMFIVIGTTFGKLYGKYNVITAS